MRGRGNLASPDTLVAIYGIHATKAVLQNEVRRVERVVATKNAISKIEHLLGERGLTAEVANPQDISNLLGKDVVHQGIVAFCEPVPPADIDDLADASLIVLLDQVTDPHNVGAIIRSAVALSANGIVTTERNSTLESGLLAKTASGGLDLITHAKVTNLAQTIVKLQDYGFYVIGLDSEGEEPIETTLHGDKIALVLGAEGSGLRRLTRERCDALARLDMPGAIKSLNVSNAATLSLYLSAKHLGKLER